MDIKIINDLQKLNFTLNEAKIYTSLSELGQTTAGELIKSTGLHRSVTYDTLDKLISRKLVFKLIKKGVTVYQLTDPNKLLQNLKVQQDIASDLIPKIKNLMNSKLPEITIYEGRESYRDYWLSSTQNLKPGTTDYVAGSLGKKWHELLGREAAEKFLKYRIQRKIKWKMIIFNTDPLELELLKQFPHLHEYRLVDEVYKTHGNFNVFGDENVMLHSATEPMIIEIKNPTLVKVFKNLFEIMWRSGKEIRN